MCKLGRSFSGPFKVLVWYYGQYLGTMFLLLPWSVCVLPLIALVSVCPSSYCPGQHVSFLLLPWSVCVLPLIALVSVCHTGQ